MVERLADTGGRLGGDLDSDPSLMATSHEVIDQVVLADHEPVVTYNPAAHLVGPSSIC